jgi:hypothetical protein
MWRGVGWNDERRRKAGDGRKPFAQGRQHCMRRFWSNDGRRFQCAVDRTEEDGIACNRCEASIGARRGGSVGLNVKSAVGRVRHPRRIQLVMPDKDRRYRDGHRRWMIWSSQEHRRAGSWRCRLESERESRLGHAGVRHEGS